MSSDEQSQGQTQPVAEMSGIGAVRWPVGTAEDAIDADDDADTDEEQDFHGVKRRRTSIESDSDDATDPGSMDPAGPDESTPQQRMANLTASTPFHLQAGPTRSVRRSGRVVPPRSVRRSSRVVPETSKWFNREQTRRRENLPPGAVSDGTIILPSSRGPPGPPRALGMFATRNLRAGEVVARLKGPKINAREFEERARADKSKEYDGMQWDKRHYMVDQGLWTGHASPGDWYRINHSLIPNVDTHRGTNEITFETMRPVDKGEELLYKYDKFTPPGWLE